MVLAGANVHDIELAIPTLNAIPAVPAGNGESRTVRGLAADKGYDSKGFRAWLRGRRIRSAIPERCNRRPRPGRPLTKKPDLWSVRWKVERTHSWLNNFRRLKVRYERRSDLHLALVQFACALIAFRRF